MPRRKFIDKKSATTFQLVHRAQNDPRIHDADANDMILHEKVNPNVRQGSEMPTSSGASNYSAASGRSKIRSRGDLESEFGDRVRSNEGEAASYGVFFDDSEYDYMKHMRDIGSGGGSSYFLEAPAQKGKGKQKMDLADMLRQSGLDDRQSDAGVSVNSSVASMMSAVDLFGEDMAASEFVRKTTYQDQQNTPDAIAGFKPDMDPRLREVLEALEDEAYVEDDEDIFGQLTRDTLEVNPREWEAQGWNDQETMDRFLQEDDEDDEDDQGWESDDTIKAGGKPKKQKEPVEPTELGALPAPDAAPAAIDESDNAWLDEFNKFKKDVKASSAAPRRTAAPSAYQESVNTSASILTAGGRKKKRKGALTEGSNYSMSSSALHRTEAYTLLDQRFDKIEEEYAADDFPDDQSMMSGFSKMSGISKMSGMTGMSESSEAPVLRADFDDIMDDFLGGHAMQGKRRVKKGAYQSGLEQLDEVRNQLGPARVKGRAPKVAPKIEF